MHIGEIGEFGLIELIQKAVSAKKSGLILGIGDDAAVFKTSKSKWHCATVDALVEGIHFDLRFTDFQTLGWKSIAVNISDIAAMGGEAKWALVALAIPDQISTENILELYQGMRRCAGRFGASIIGGNISRARSDFSITVTLLGEVKSKNILERSGARDGDIIAVTGDCGAAHAGLQVLKKGLDPTKFPHCIKKHLSPMPRRNWIAGLLKHHVKINSCIDLSDGLASDLHRLCQSSKVGAELQPDRIPIHDETKAISRLCNEPASAFGLNGGEDYELLMTLPKKEFIRAKKILKNNLAAIGVITQTKKIVGIYSNGEKIEIPPNGYTHF